MLKQTLLIVLFISLLQAQSLKESVESVLETNPLILERLSNYRETAKDLSIANAEYLPSLDLSTSAGYEKTANVEIFIKNPIPTSMEYYEVSATLSLNIFDGFGTVNKTHYHKARILASAYNFIEKANDTVLRTTRTYIEAVKQRELELIAQENVVEIESIFKKINELYENGIATKSEVRKIESALFLARSNALVKKNNAMDAMFNFKQILGRKINIESLTIPDFDVYLPRTLEEASSYTIRNNPSVMVESYNIKAAQYLKKQKEKTFYPKVDLMLQQNLDRNTYGAYGERNRFRAGVNLTWNLYRGGADINEMEKSISSIHKNIQTRSKIYREAIAGLELSWSAHTITTLQLKELKKYKDYSFETLNLYKDEYELGQRTLLDLLSAQNDFITSSTQIINARYDNLFAKYRILDSMGLLVAGVMGNHYDYMQKVGLTHKKARNNKDTLPFKYDSDNDNISSIEDECPNSLFNATVTSNGCLDETNPKRKSFKMITFNERGEIISSQEDFNTTIQNIKQNKNNIQKIEIHSYSSLGRSVLHDKKQSDLYAKKVKKNIIDTGINNSIIKIVSNGSGIPLSTDDKHNNRVNIITYLK